MDVKEFMESPRQALVEMGLSENDSQSLRLLDLTRRLTICKSQIKDIKKEKADVARQFKAITPTTVEHVELIAAMQLVSNKIKFLEDQYKATENEFKQALVPIHESHAAVGVKPPFVFIEPSNIYKSDYTIRELSESELDDWYEFLASRKTTAYHQRAWAQLIAGSFARPTKIWAAFSSSGAILGGLPLTIFDSKLFGRFAVSMPYFNYGGVISSWFNIAESLVVHLRAVCVQENFSHIEIRTMQADLGPNVSNKKASMILQLPKTDAFLEEQLGAKVRAQYKKAELHNPLIRFGKLELLDDFYAVFARNMRDLGTPVYAKKWFGNILSQPDVTSHVAVVYVGGRPVSCGFLIGYRNMLEIPWASTVKEANAMNTNMWMYRHILKFAVEQGYQFFDFGRSTQDAGTYKFKKQWGAKPYTHHWYYIFPEGGAVPELNPDNPKYKLMIAIWQRLPVWLTKIIGPPIVSNLP